jgi:hypothetical protein
MRITRIFLLFVVSIFLFNSTTVANGQMEKHQATFIYNFTRLVQWPNLQSQPAFVIAIIGRNHPLTAELRTTAGERRAGGREIKVIEYASAEEVELCHILFVPNNRMNQLKRASEKLDKEPVLIITEFQGRQPVESVINLSLENDRLGYKLDEEHAKRRNLLISSQLSNYSR